jgi:hypothetical protein
MLDWIEITALLFHLLQTISVYCKCIDNLRLKLVATLITNQISWLEAKFWKIEGCKQIALALRTAIIVESKLNWFVWKL